MQVKTTVVVKSKKASRMGAFASLVSMLCLSAGAADLTIDGGTLTEWNEESKSYGTLYIGSVNGSGSLLAIDSIIELSNYLYFGYQNTADDITYSSNLVLTNTSLTCDTFSLGFCVKGGNGNRDGSERIQAEVGPGSIVTIKAKMNRNCQPWSRVKFTGGRIVFARSAADPGAALCIVYGRDANNYFYNTGMTWEGVDAPIDIEVAKDSLFASGWGSRRFNLEGNGGLVKRGAGVLTWGWRASNGADYLLGDATYTGDTVIKAGGIRLDTPVSSSSNTARYSIPASSPLKIEDGAFFDFAGNDAAWVSVSGDGVLTNSSATAATLTVGAGNADCLLAVSKAVGAINVAKTGSGILTVDVPKIEGALTVSEGALVVAPGASLEVDSISAAVGTTLDFRGATVKCGVITAPKGVAVLTDSTTDLSWTLNAEEEMQYVAGSFACDGNFTKSGSATVTFFGPCAKTGGSVNIAEGRFVCTNVPTFGGKYYRLQYKYAAKKAEGSSDNGSIQFSEFSLYGTSGKRINEGGFSYVPITGTATLQYGGYDGIDDAATLSEREVAVWMPTHDQFFNYDTDPSWGGSPLAVFDGNKVTKLRNTSYWESSSIIVFRLGNDAEDAIGFTFTTSDYPIRRPTEWKLDGSVDGATWTTLAVREAESSLSSAEKWLWRTNSTPNTTYTEYNGGFPYTFDSLPAPIRYAPFGAATVSVAEGATLQLDSTMTLSSLRVDMNGAGTITTLVPSENGALYLENVQGDRIGGEVALPLNVSSVVGPAALKTWTVHVNGVPSGYIVRWNGLNLIVGPKPGLVLSYR